MIEDHLRAPMTGWDGTPLTMALLDRVAADLLVNRGMDFESPAFKYRMESVIIRYFLGDEWFEKHCGLRAKPNFLAPIFGDSDEPDWNYSIHILLLAEMLYNLQDIGGFGVCLQHMSGMQTESGFAELQVGSVLKKAAIDFRYLDPNSPQKPRYDLEMMFPHGTACGEIKCKSQNKEPTPVRVAKAIQTARQQIPPDKVGIVFIKLPQHWVKEGNRDATKAADITIPVDMRETVANELAKTTRIKKVIFYVLHKAVDPSFGIGATHFTAEMRSPLNDADSPWNPEITRPASSSTWTSILDMNERWRRFGPGLR